jgi:hypothetical protein
MTIHTFEANVTYIASGISLINNQHIWGNSLVLPNGKKKTIQAHITNNTRESLPPIEVEVCMDELNGENKLILRTHENMKPNDTVSTDIKK